MCVHACVCTCVYVYVCVYACVCTCVFLGGNLELSFFNTFYLTFSVFRLHALYNCHCICACVHVHARAHVRIHVQRVHMYTCDSD